MPVFTIYEADEIYITSKEFLEFVEFQDSYFESPCYFLLVRHERTVQGINPRTAYYILYTIIYNLVDLDDPSLIFSSTPLLFAPPLQIPGSKIERNRYRSGISARYIVYGAVSSSIALNADILSNTRLRGTTYHAFNTLTSYRILRAPHFRFFNPVQAALTRVTHIFGRECEQKENVSSLLHSFYLLFVRYVIRFSLHRESKWKQVQNSRRVDTSRREISISREKFVQLFLKLMNKRTSKGVPRNALISRLFVYIA